MEPRRKLSEAGIELEISEVADGGDDTFGDVASRRVNDLEGGGEFNVLFEVVEFHGRGFDGRGKIFANAAKVFPGDSFDFAGCFLSSETKLEIAERDATMTGIEPIGNSPAKAAKASNCPKRQRLEDIDDESGDQIEQGFHISGNRSCAHNPRNRWRRGEFLFRRA